MYNLQRRKRFIIYWENGRDSNLISKSLTEYDDYIPWSSLFFQAHHNTPSFHFPELSLHALWRPTTIAVWVRLQTCLAIVCLREKKSLKAFVASELLSNTKCSPPSRGRGGEWFPPFLIIPKKKKKKGKPDTQVRQNASIMPCTPCLC